MAARKRVVVLGSGSGGMAAAVSAAVAGAEVTLLESAEHIGGTTAISGGAVWMPANPWSAAEGVEDSQDDGVRYLRALALGDADDAVAEAYVREGVAALEAIERHTELRWRHMGGFPDYHAEADGGKQAGRGIEIMPIAVDAAIRARVRADPYEVPPARIAEAGAGEPGEAELARRVREGVLARGPGLIAGLCATLLAHGGTVRTGVRATELALADGAVVGVRLDGETIPGEVVIATGGFERNAQLVKTFLRGPLAAPAGPPTNRGDGLLMAMAAGAALGNMSEAWWAPAMEVPGETIDGAPFFRMMFTDCAHPGGILVDGNGRRFADEAVNYSDLGRCFHAFDGGRYGFPGTGAWLVLDAVRKAERGFVGDTVWSLNPSDEEQPAARAGDAADPSWLVRADTVEQLAERIGVPPATLAETVARWNAQAARGVDDDFGRGATIYDRFSQGGIGLRPVAEPPFYAVRALPGSLGTKGGMRTDAHGRVLGLDGAPIAGLYAAGNAAASPFGLAYPGPGATVGPALVFGWRAGQLAAA